jgi:hypothetical protein
LGCETATRIALRFIGGATMEAIAIAGGEVVILAVAFSNRLVREVADIMIGEEIGKAAHWICHHVFSQKRLTRATNNSNLSKRKYNINKAFIHV